MPIELVAMHQPRGGVAEAFRTIRTGLAFTLPGSGPSALVVTSATPGDGKSFVSVNLAFSLAQTGKRVLLVDADLRRARLHDIFRVDPSQGVSTALTPGSSANLTGVRRTGCPTLDVMPAGPLPPNPAELLGGPAFEVLLQEALRQYDWVVFDAPPLTAVADPSILLAHVPHAIFVVRPFATLKGAAQRARELLEKTPGRVAGIVLNTADVPQGQTRDYSYGGYDYRYQPDKRDREPTSSRSDPAIPT